MIRRGGRLRLAIPAHVMQLRPLIGHGRVWRSVVAELERLADVRIIGSGTRPRRRVDAWIIDGHHEPVQTTAPVVAQMHETSWRIPEVRGSLDQRFIDEVERRTFDTVRCVDRIVTASHVTREQLAEFCDFPLERIDVVPHGVDVELFTPRRGPGRERVGGPYVLFAGTLHPRKNLGSLRTAMAALAANGMAQRLAIVAGPAPDRDDSSDLEAAAFAELPGAPGRIVRIVKPTDAELAELMADADAFVLPSLWEGFGLTALEALACGAPTIVSARGALPEVVGDAGLTAEPTPQGIEQALRTVLTDEALSERMRAAGRARAEGMTWRHTARGWLETIERARMLPRR